MLDQATFEKYASDPATFRADLFVDVNGNVYRFGDVQDDWQRDAFLAVDDAWVRCVGREKKTTGRAKAVRMRSWQELGRGHSKTTSLAMMCCWALTFAIRPLRGYSFAADQDQASLLKDAMATICRLNPWVGKILDVQKNLVVNVAKKHPGEGSKLQISASDVGSSYGLLGDFFCLDEITNWPGDGSLWHSILSSAAKRSNSLLSVITNAGWVDSVAWNIREAVRNDPSWIFSRLDGPHASWLTPERLAEQRRMLPKTAYERLWGNKWCTGGGDALREEDIRAAFRDDLKPMTGHEQDWAFIAGVDLGKTRDWSAVVVLAVPIEGKHGGVVRLAHHKIWKPPVGGKINPMDVEKHLYELDNRLDLYHIAFDPYEADLLTTRLDLFSQHKSRRSRWATKRSRPWCWEVTPNATNLRDIASRTIEYFTDRRVRLYECEPLRRDLLKLRAEEKSYGMRLTSPRDSEGHGDTFSAFANALLVGHQVAGQKQIVIGAYCSDSGPRSNWAERWQREQDEWERERIYLDSLPDDSADFIRRPI